MRSVTRARSLWGASSTLRRSLQDLTHHATHLYLRLEPAHTHACIHTRTHKRLNPVVCNFDFEPPEPPLFVLEVQFVRPVDHALMWDTSNLMAKPMKNHQAPVAGATAADYRTRGWLGFHGYLCHGTHGLVAMT